MKIALLLLVVSVVTAFGDARIVLAEFSTNTSCFPCVDGTHALDSALANIGRDRFAVIRYHTSAPSTLDPFYQSNKDECGYRANTYGLQSNPVLLLDGANAGPTDTLWKQAMDTALTRPSAVSIALSGTFSGTSGVVNVELSSLPAGGELLFGAITESGIEFLGMNGEDIHDDVFQHTITGWSGAQPDSLAKHFSFELGTDSSAAPPFIHQWDPDSCRIVVWLQNPNTLVVAQAAQIRIRTLSSAHVAADIPPTNVLNVFPNPATDHMELHLDERSFSSELIVCDLLGRVIFSARGDHIPASIDLPPFPAGVYRVLLRDGGKIISASIAVRK